MRKRPGFITARPLITGARRKGRSTPCVRTNSLSMASILTDGGSVTYGAGRAPPPLMVGRVNREPTHAMLMPARR